MSERLKKLNESQKTAPFICKKCGAIVYAFACVCGRPLQGSVIPKKDSKSSDFS